MRWANYFALTPTIRPSRANFFAHGPPPMGTLKPTTPLRAPEQQPLKPPSPLLAPNKGPLKPTTPLRPKNAPKTPNSHPQRRRRFQSRLGQHPQRRWRFQTTGPPGRQSLTTAPVGSIGAWPGDQWAADVTNVVKPTRFTSPLEGLCYKRRQSASKNLDFQRKSRRIDDVCNNGSEIHTENTSD